jgi:SnoaL-like polyketide cyclase
MSGIHEGKFGGIPPTGTCVSVQQVHWFCIANAKVAEHWVIRDDLRCGSWASSPSPSSLSKPALPSRADIRYRISEKTNPLEYSVNKGKKRRGLDKSTVSSYGMRPKAFLTESESPCANPGTNKVTRPAPVTSRRHWRCDTTRVCCTGWRSPTLHRSSLAGPNISLSA